MGRPTAIDDEDSDFARPRIFDDEFPISDGFPRASSASDLMLTTTVLTNVARCISQILRLLKSPSISLPTLELIEQQIGNCIQSFPAHHQIHASDYIHPQALSPLIYLQTARLLVHRRNITPNSTPEVKSRAIENCLRVAQDTTLIISRTMRGKSEMVDTSWEETMRLAATAFLCLHIWRTTLFLCFRGDYQAAVVCVRASGAIGKARAINVSCGRYLQFFLDTLITVLRRGEGPHFDRNPDMIAYLSGDLQGSLDSSWVWEGSGDEGSRPETNEGYNQGPDAVLPQAAPLQDWDGWEDILSKLTDLAEEQRRHGGRSPHEYTASYLSPVVNTQNPAVSPGGSTRISIQDII
jgi:hypothetical protein